MLERVPWDLKPLNSFDFSRSYGRLSQNPKIGEFRELFLPENDFKTCSTVHFPKNTDFGGLETSQRDKFRLEFFYHMLFYIWTQYKNCLGHLIGTSSKNNRFWGQD